MTPLKPLGATVDGIALVDHGDKTYKVKNGTYYHIETPDSMVHLLERIRISQQRVRFHWGDTETGKDWGDRYDVKGTLGRSMGPVKVPLLIHTVRSLGGGAILDHCVVKITTTKTPKQTIYQHPKYHT